MIPPPSLLKLITCLEGSAVPHIPLDTQAIGEESHASITILLDLATVSSITWRREVALVALWRAFLNLLPASVIENPNAKVRPRVKQRLEFLLGGAPDEADLKLIVSIVRRLQRYQIDGRKASSLNLSQIIQRNILSNQADRCANCGYKFRKGDLRPDPSSTDPDDQPATDSPLGKTDHSPNEIKRRAVLDHIFPVYLAGDSSNNWQILCYTCNSGKSDMIYGFEGRLWFGSPRKEHLTMVRPQLFYMVMNNERHCNNCHRGVRQVELRVVRKDQNGANLYPNLTARCTDCI